MVHGLVNTSTYSPSFHEVPPFDSFEYLLLPLFLAHRGESRSVFEIAHEILIIPEIYIPPLNCMRAITTRSHKKGPLEPCWVKQSDHQVPCKLYEPVTLVMEL